MRASVFKTIEVDCFVVQDAVAPAHEHDALPFEGQSAHRGRISFATGDLFFEEEFGPRAVEGRLAGVFKEALMDEVRPGPTAMHPMLVFAALLLHRSDPAILLDGEGALVARTFTPKSTAEARRQSRTASREALPEGSVLMLGKEMLDPGVVLCECGPKLE